MTQCSFFFLNKSGRHRFTEAPMRSAVARAGWPPAILSGGLAIMGRAETEQIPQDTGKLFFQRKEFFPRSQAAFHFHRKSATFLTQIQGLC
jgi:hypothetical protein